MWPVIMVNYINKKWDLKMDSKQGCLQFGDLKYILALS